MGFPFAYLQGCGKSVIAKEFAEMLGYTTEPIMLYQVECKQFTHTRTGFKKKNHTFVCEPKIYI